MSAQAAKPAAIDGLDAAVIAGALPQVARAQLHSLSISPVTVSTQLDALSATTPAHGCAVFFAEQQTGGVGRNGHSWASPPSTNLYFSVSRAFSRQLSEMTGLSLVVGIAMAEALHGLGFVAVRLKWPNDLLVDGRKLGGILVQLRNDPPGSQAVVGIGLNVHMPAEAAQSIDQPWCDLFQLDPRKVARNDVAAAVLAGLLPALQAFDEDGLAPFHARWQALDALQGRAVRVLDGARQFEGECLGIDNQGALRLRSASGELRNFHGGEVSLRLA